ncbi:MAG: phosphatase PAP2-related protein [Nanoarchaeota archaeon]|nr:phosphatase PAP2-related protein [Nanoarchaeota archaeon]
MSITKRINAKFKLWKKEISDNKELIALSLFLLVLSVVINYNAGKYTTNVGTTVVPDFIIDNTKAIDLTWLFVYGWMVIVGMLFIYPLFFRTSKISDTISHFSLLIIIRSFFITLTHLKTPLDAIPIGFPGALNLLAFQNDLFFSGHTAVPFLGFLLFKNDKIRYIFLIASFVLAFTVLMMHQHYSIDVISAYFITYGTYKLGKFLFKNLEKSKD